MEKAKLDSFAKVRLVYIIVFVVVAFVFSVIFSKGCYDTVKDNSEKIKKDFNNYYQLAEDKMDMYQRIGNLLFENNEVKNFFEELGKKENIYRYFTLGGIIKSYTDIFNDINSQIILTDLEHEICIRRGGSMRLYELRDELGLDAEEIEEIKYSDKTFFLKKKSDMLIFILQNEYYNSDKPAYCFIVTDMNFFLPNLSLDIVEDVEKDKNGDISFSKTSHIKESLHIPEVFYVYTVDSNNIFMTLIFIMLNIVCIICIFLSKKLAEKFLNVTYRPIIENVIKRRKDESDTDVILWDESVRKLFYENELLERDIKESKVFQKKMYLRNVLCSADDFYINDAKRFGLDDFDNGCRVILLSCEQGSKYQLAKGLLQSSDFEINLEKQLDLNLKGELIVVSEGKYAYITAICDEDFLRKKLVQILDFFDIYGVESFVSVGRSVDGVSRANVSYRDALECVEKKTVFPMRSVVFSEELPKSEILYYYPIDVEISLIENVLSGEKEKVIEILSDVLKKNLHDSYLEKEQLHEFKIMLVSTINRIINRMNKTSKEIFGEDLNLYLEVGASRNKEELANNVKDIFEKLCVSNEKNVSSKQEKLSKEIVSFIDNNFDDCELSLEKVARKFYISQNHVSRVLKNSIGKGYKEYLNYVRLEKVKKLLTSSQMSVNAIANKVGYTDMSAFNRLFKKYTQQTPNDYRIKNSK